MKNLPEIWDAHAAPIWAPNFTGKLQSTWNPAWKATIFLGRKPGFQGGKLGDWPRGKKWGDEKWSSHVIFSPYFFQDRKMRWNRHERDISKLVGGAITILKNMKVNGEDGIPYILWKIKNVWNHQPVFFLFLIPRGQMGTKAWHIWSLSWFLHDFYSINVSEWFSDTSHPWTWLVALQNPRLTKKARKWGLNEVDL